MILIIVWVLQIVRLIIMEILIQGNVWSIVLVYREHKCTLIRTPMWRCASMCARMVTTDRIEQIIGHVLHHVWVISLLIMLRWLVLRSARLVRMHILMGHVWTLVLHLPLLIPTLHPSARQHAQAGYLVTLQPEHVCLSVHMVILVMLPTDILVSKLVLLILSSVIHWIGYV